MDLEEILKKENIKEYKKDIRKMSKRELKKNFSAVSSKKPKAAIIIKNLIWQTYTQIKAGKHPTIEGNLRTYWYSHVKPTLARVNLLRGYDHYHTTLDCFAEFTKDYKLFRYADFDFDDENWENRRIADRMFSVILFAEKNGWIRTLKKLHEEFGMTIATLNGMPSLLSSEYTVNHLSKVTSLDQKFLVISAVDYDPSGWIIANAYVEHLKSQGVKECELVNIITLDNFTEEEIELYKYPVPRKNSTKVKKWLAKTGGIDGKPFGLEAEAMPRDRFRRLAREALRGFGIRI